MKAIFPGIEFLTILYMLKKKTKEKSFSMLTSHALEGFTSWSRTGRQRNVLKSVMHVQSCCFGHKPNCFLTSSLSLSSRMLKLKGVFERSTSTESDDFSLLICPDAVKLVLLSFFTLAERFN